MSNSNKEEFKGQAEFTGGADKASCPLAELLKDKEAVKELADIFADSVVNKFAERFGSTAPPSRAFNVYLG